MQFTYQPFGSKKKVMAIPNSVLRFSWSRPWRWAKTLFFLSTMLASLLLLVAPPILVVVLDLLLLPLVASLFTSASNSPLFAASLLSLQNLKCVNFRSSLADLPLVSAARSFSILCAYVVCDGCRGLYLGFTVLCSLLSIAYLLLKAVSIYSSSRVVVLLEEKDTTAMEALFLSSSAMAMAHIVVACRGSWRERRKLLVYRIDVEAVIRLNGGQIKGERVISYEES
ncbi:hypothetical protein Cni_G08861 [Canna indica]|uniref:Uncharacterized protein n=1 Tax=Canna indica TaxID=4628 RepID=A0AAQ3Q8T3_9LILI|nr:hypothetical protein Cni_G08861 [Canna indica]